MWLLLLACGAESACDTPECRRDQVLQAWAQSPDAGRAALDRIDDDLERRVLIEDLAERYPGQTRDLCPTLPKGELRAWCERLNQRAHLWSAPPEVPLARQERAGGGPNTAHLLVSPDVVSTWSLSPDPGDCSANSCLSDAAQQLAGTEPQAGAARCAAIEVPALRSECLFALAESVLHEQGPRAYGDSVQLCVLAEGFTRQCLGHTVQRLGLNHAPDAATGTPQAWARAAQVADQVDQTWQMVDPGLAEHAVHAYWSALFAQSYAETAAVTALDVPAAALPHQRASAALRYLELHQVDSLEGAVEGLTLALQAPAQRGPTPDKRRTRAGIDGHWRVDTPGDETWPAVLYVSTSRRTWSPDPQVDLTLCLVEAAARLPGREWLVEQAATHPDPGVQWTAARLMAELEKRPAHDKKPPPPRAD